MMSAPEMLRYNSDSVFECRRMASFFLDNAKTLY